MHPPEYYFSVEIEVVDVLWPVVDGNSMQLVRLEDHGLFIPHSDYHCYVVEIAIGEKSLHFGPQVLGVKQKDVTCLCLGEELSLGQGVFVQVG